MPPFNYDENMKPTEDTSWYLNENKGYWQPVNRKSSFSDINLALRNAANSSNTSEYVKEFRRHLNNEKKRMKTVERQRLLENRKIFLILSWTWSHTFKHIRDDWLCLALLGFFMALLSVGVDKGIELCSSGKYSQI